MPLRAGKYPELRYMGSKKRLLPWIHEVLDTLDFESALDPFSGTGCVTYVDGNPVVYIDAFGLCWIYSQSTGKLTHVNVIGKVDYTAMGYSGSGVGKNNPQMQNASKIGPIPQGTYTIGRAYSHKTKGPVVMNLEPSASNNMYGRDLFRIHGDSTRHPGQASEGCIIVPRVVREMVDNSNDKCLRVVR